MNNLRGFSCPVGARELHGCDLGSAWIALGRTWSMVLLAVAISFGGAQTARGELMLYITDGTNTLTILDNDSVYDTSELVDTMYLDVGQLESVFTGWDFGAFFDIYTNLTEIDGRPNQVLNINFEATNTSASTASLEVLATYVGSNGRSEPTTILMSGGARTSQLSGLGYTFVGAYSQDEADTFYTNGYNEQDGALQYVRVTAPSFNDDPDSDNLVLDLNSEPPKDIEGSPTYALTYGVKITNLESGKFFGTLSQLEYVLPEPASIATWAVAVGLVGLAGKRKRKARTL